MAVRHGLIVKTVEIFHNKDWDFKKGKTSVLNEKHRLKVSVYSIFCCSWHWKNSKIQRTCLDPCRVMTKNRFWVTTFCKTFYTFSKYKIFTNCVQRVTKCAKMFTKCVNRFSKHDFGHNFLKREFLPKCKVLASRVKIHFLGEPTLSTKICGVEPNYWINSQIIYLESMWQGSS